MNEGCELIHYRVKHMQLMDSRAADMAKYTRWVHVIEENKDLAAKEFVTGPWLFGHGTTIEKGFAILQSGGFLSSVSGKIGSGVYGFYVGPQSKIDDYSVMEVYKRAASGGYNLGCLFVFKADGIITKRCEKKNQSASWSCFDRW